VPRPERASADRADRHALADAAGAFETVEVKWFNRSKGYGFLNRPKMESEDIFVHMETVRACGLRELIQGQLVEARIAESAKGLTAVELRQP
jgi:CspA family cold shock protein